MSILLFLFTGMVLGMRHSLDADHVVAVSTLVAEEHRPWPAARLGFVWGLGHLLPLTLAGLPIMLLRLTLPATMEQTVDLGVGLLLVALGVRTLWRLRQDRVHFHVHVHGGQEHAHFHPHGKDATHSHPGVHDHVHPLPGRERRTLLTFFSGVMQGLAGSGAAVVLALTAAPSLISGVAYLMAFGVGNIIGMFAMTLLVAAPVLSGLARFRAWHGTIRMAAGLSSVALGVFMWYNILPQLMS